MPGLNAPLSIRINDGRTDRYVTRYCRGLKFTKTAPGGHKSCSFTMTLPRNLFPDLGPADRCYVYDGRTTETIFDAYLENPTPGDGPLGQQFDISAVGGMALANDESRGLVYLDRGPANWARVEYGATALAATAEQYADATVAANVGMRAQFTPGGSPVTTSQVAAIDHRLMERAGMFIAAVRTVTQSGKTDAGYRTDLYDFTTATSVADPAGIQTGAFDETFWVGADIGDTGAVLLQLRRSGASTNVADDTTWTTFLGLSVLGRRYDRYGNLLGTEAAHGANALAVLASQVVEDLLGRLLTFCDPTTADIQATAWAIDQLAYPDGTKAAGILNDLELWEPDHDWGIGATGPSGLHDFWYRPWPTEPRYEVSVKDGWRQTGSDVDLCNRILVSWTDSTGKTQTLPVTAADLGLIGIGLPVDALGSRVKDADPISLPDGLGSTANALRIGGAILADKINPPKAGTVVVRRPIMNLHTGVEEMPWELEPGAPVRVRETGDELRCTEVAYDDDSVSSAFTLGRPVLTVEQRVARLSAA